MRAHQGDGARRRFYPVVIILVIILGHVRLRFRKPLQAGPQVGGCALPEGKCSRRWSPNASPVTKFVLGFPGSEKSIVAGKIMCGCKIDRRTLAKLLAGAAGAGLLSTGAQAATVTALAITCIDYRLVDDAVRFFDGKHLTKDYDQVSLAGASLAAVSDKFPSANAAFGTSSGLPSSFTISKKSSWWITATAAPTRDRKSVV